MLENTVKTYVRINGQDVDADSVDAPADRTYRGAWVNSGARIVVDMDKARDIHRDNLRRDRAPLLEALDIQFMRALEGGHATADITEQKRVLRDVTSDPRIDAMDTPEGLAALTLEVLVPHE